MDVARASNTATVLRDGRVLLAGGSRVRDRRHSLLQDSTGDELLAVVRSMIRAHANATATLLSDGGTDRRRNRRRVSLDSTQYFDPETDAFSAGPELAAPRSAHAAVLDHGRMILIGGTIDGHSAPATTDVLHDGRWGRGPLLLQQRIKHAATVLPNGMVLVVGGATTAEGRQRLASTEPLDLRTTRSSRGPNLSEGEYKLEGALTTLPDGRMVIAGGTKVDVYEPNSDTVAVLPVPPAPQYSFVTATAFGSHTVLIAVASTRASPLPHELASYGFLKPEPATLPLIGMRRR